MHPVLKPRPLATAALFALAFTPTSTATPQHTEGPLPDQLSTRIAPDFAQQHAGYRAFLAQNPGRWNVRVDENGGTPVLITGEGIPLGYRPDSIEAARTAAQQLLIQLEGLWGIPASELFFERGIEHNNRFVLIWQQWHAGYEVRGARVTIQVHKTGAISALGATTVAIPLSFELTPRLTADQAVDIVSAGKLLEASDTLLASVPFVHVTRAGGRSKPHLAYEVTVDQRSRHIAEFVTVDAASGEVLQVRSGLHGGSGTINGNVHGFANDEVTALGSPNSVALEGIEVQVTGSGPFVTNSLGEFSGNIPGGLPSVSADLSGPTFEVRNEAIGGSNLQPLVQTGISGGHVTSNIEFNSQPTPEDTAQATAAYLAQQTWNYCVSRIPAFHPNPQTVLQLLVNKPLVLGSECNGSFNEFSLALEFAGGGSSCPNPCYSSFFEHEFGHYLDYEVDGEIFTDVSMKEGVPDILAMFSTGQPIIGKDHFGTSDLRTGLQPDTWPPIVGGLQVHAAGTPIRGVAWEIWVALTDKLGPTAGRQAAESIVFSAFDHNEFDAAAAVHEMFVADDDDADLLNGTPNYNELAEAALNRGFFPPQVEVIELQPIQHPDTWNQTQALAIFATVSPKAAGDAPIDSVSVTWEAPTGSGSAPMLPWETAETWRGEIPALWTQGVVQYWIEATNTEGIRATAGPFPIAVGAKTTLYFDGLETSGSGWTATGDWEFGAPGTANPYDPSEPYSGANIAGTDLGTTGDGVYGFGPSQVTAPTVDATGRTGTRLRFARWLTVRPVHDAEILLTTAALPIDIYTNEDQAVIDNEWTLLDMPTPQLDGTSGNFVWKLRGTQGNTAYGGWSIDDIEVYTLEASPLIDLQLSASSTNPSVGTSIQLSLSSQSGLNWSLFMSPNPGPTAIAGYGILELGAGSIPLTSGPLPPIGTTVATLPLTDPALAGTTWYLQAIGTAPGALPQISNPVTIHIQ